MQPHSRCDTTHNTLQQWITAPSIVHAACMFYVELTFASVRSHPTSQTVPQSFSCSTSTRPSHCVAPPRRRTLVARAPTTQTASTARTLARSPRGLNAMKQRPLAKLETPLFCMFFFISDLEKIVPAELASFLDMRIELHICQHCILNYHATRGGWGCIAGPRDPGAGVQQTAAPPRHES